MSRQWSVDNGDIAVGRFRITSGSPRELVGWHNADITALEAERDEFRRRLEEVVDIYETETLAAEIANDIFHQPTIEKQGVVRAVLAHMYRRQRAIAEGRTDGN